MIKNKKCPICGRLIPVNGTPAHLGLHKHGYIGKDGKITKKWLDMNNKNRIEFENRMNPFKEVPYTEVTQFKEIWRHKK